MNELFRFIRAVGVYWVLVLGSAAVGAVTLLREGFGGGPWPKVLVLGFCVLAAMVSFFLVWRDEYRGRLKAEEELQNQLNAMPYPILRPVVEDGRVFIEVRNDGAQALFDGTVLASGLGKTGKASLYWEDERREGPVLIAPKTSRRFFLAENVMGVDSDDILGLGRGNRQEYLAWRVLGLKDRWQRWVFGHRPKTAGPGGEWARIRIELMSDPEMRQGSEAREYVLEGYEFCDISSGQRIHVEPRDVANPGSPRGVAKVIRP